MELVSKEEKKIKATLHKVTGFTGHVVGAVEQRIQLVIDSVDSLLF